MDPVCLVVILAALLGPDPRERLQERTEWKASTARVRCFEDGSVVLRPPRGKVVRLGVPW